MSIHPLAAFVQGDHVWPPSALFATQPEPPPPHEPNPAQTVIGSSGASATQKHELENLPGTPVI